MTFLNKIEESTLFYPRKLTLSLTTNCNLSCQHCWVECDSHNPKGIVAPKEGVIRSIKDFIELGGKEICLTGGEPLTHPDFLEILEFCINSKLEAVSLQTNATLLNTAHLKTFCNFDKEKLFFQVSLDGATASTNDFVRGDGSYIRATQGLSGLVKSGFGEQITIGFTEMRHNMHEIPDMLKYAENAGIKSVVGWSLVDFGKASQTDRLGPPTPSQYEQLLELYHQDSDFRVLYDQYGTFAAIEWYKGVSHPEGHSCRF
ncbi:MAG: radical SAM protein, partial [Deltaproteobacteria bacterium]|nr:radical SAM protein [Deltaproteobacteria bacterium]